MFSLFMRKRLIRFFDGTEVNHASVCIGDGKVVEAVGAGIKCNTIRAAFEMLNTASFDE
jgi:hypothetical protein